MAQKYEKVVQEDLNVGTGMVWVKAPAGGELRATQVGLHTVARNQLSYTSSWTPGAIATTAYASTTIAVPNAAVGDMVIASHDKILTNALSITGHVSAAGTVMVVIQNPTSSTVTVAAGTLEVIVFPVGATVTVGIVTGTVYRDAEEAGNELSGATVTILAQGLSTTTNASGVYTLTGVAPGSVDVDASAVGYTDDGVTVVVVAGQTTTANIVLAGA